MQNATLGPSFSRSVYAIGAFWQMQVANEVGNVRSEEALVAVLPLQSHSHQPAPESHVLKEEQPDPPQSSQPPEIISQPRCATPTLSFTSLRNAYCLECALLKLSGPCNVKLRFSWGGNDTAATFVSHRLLQLHPGGDSACVIAASLVSSATQTRHCSSPPWSLTTLTLNCFCISCVMLLLIITILTSK